MSAANIGSPQDSLDGAGNGSVIALLKAIKGYFLTGASLFVAGGIASGAADSGNPVKVGGKYNATPPTFTDGQRGDLQLDGDGSLQVSVRDFLSQGYSAAVSLTRPNDSTPYTAGDAVGPAAAALTFASMGPSGKEVIITSAALEIDVTAVPSGMTSYRIHLYNVTPPSALDDNAAWDLPSGDRASYLGYVDLGTPVDLGSTLYVETNGINKQVKLAGTSLFGYLVTNGGYTPSAQAVKVVTLHTVAV